MHLGVNLRGPGLGEVGVFHAEMAEATTRGLPAAIHTMQGGHTEVRARDLAAPDLLARAGA